MRYLTAFSALFLLTQELSADTEKPEWLAIRHIESKGVGYKTGYTTIEGFFTVPKMLQDYYMPFLDVRGHVFNDGKPAANVGIGLRYLSSRIYGANIYYDYRNDRKKNYNQVGAGLETLGSDWDFRINGYLPVGSKESPFYDRQFGFFQGHNVYLSRKQQFAMAGGNAEVGYHLKDMRYFQGYAAAGPYYFTGKGKHAIGGEARFYAQLYDYVGLQLSASYDSIFKTTVQGEVSLTFAFGPKQAVVPTECRTCSEERVLRTRALQKVDRNEIIVLDRKRETSIAIDPATGLPYTFWFVNNTSSSLGTFESPFPTLSEAENASSPYDIIYVFEGDGTSNGMNTGINLKNNQMLLGSATAHSLPTTVGTITIPGFTSLMPLFISPGGIAINLANNNRVSGIHVDEAAFGISGIDVVGVTIQNNIFTAPSFQESVKLTNVTGSINILENAFSTTDIMAATKGVSISNSGGSSTIYVSKNSFLNHRTTGIEVIGTGTSFQDIIITGNSVIAPLGVVSTVGISVAESNSARATAFIGGNELSMQEAMGISVLSQNDAYIRSTVVRNMVNLQLLDVSLNVGIYAQVLNDSAQDSIIVDNRIGLTNNFGIGFVNQGSGDSSVEINENFVRGGGQDVTMFFFGGGIAVAPQGSGNVRAIVQGNTLTQNLAEGGFVAVAINIFASPTPGALCLRMSGNTSDTGYFLYNPDLGMLGNPPIYLENGYQSNSGLINGVSPHSSSIPPAPAVSFFGPGGPITIVQPGTCE